MKKTREILDRNKFWKELTRDWTLEAKKRLIKDLKDNNIK